LSKCAFFAAVILGAGGQCVVHSLVGWNLGTKELNSVGESRAAAMALTGQSAASGLLQRGESVMRHAVAGWSQGRNTSWATQSKSCLSWHTAARTRGITRLEV